MSTVTRFADLDRSLHVGVVLMGGVTELLDVAVIDMISGLDKQFIKTIPGVPEELRAQAIDVVFHWVSEAGPATPSRLNCGITLVPTDSFEDCPHLDIVVMGAHLAGYVPTATELAFVRRTYETCSAFIAICGGVQVPLMAGLLDGKKATGPRFLLDMFRQQAPATEWLEKRWVRDGKMWTSGALLNGLDLMHAFAHEHWGNVSGDEESLVGFSCKITAWPNRDIDYKDTRRFGGDGGALRLGGAYSKRGGGPNGHFDGRRRHDTATNNRYNYANLPKENEKLQKFYDELLQLPEEERAEFWTAYQRELPNSFRFCGSKGHASEVMKLMETRYIPEITEIAYEGQPVDPPKAVPWYPDLLAWWMTTPKNVVRKFPPFAKFQKFLVSETSVGNISRQEVVSMIPPLVLDVKPGMTVLDMCAAPGSKASQLLEMIHVGEEARISNFMKNFSGDQSADTAPTVEDGADLEVDAGDDGRATGMLIANDAEYKRCHMLVHQLKRLSSPNLIVTNHDATLYPSIRIPSSDPNTNAYLKFDRILADVPCSGDGTLRKNVNLWREWVPGSALGLHLTQTRILVRALQMLKVGGKMVYSTCSMNPVENESVINAAIDRCGGLNNVDILDSSDKLPGLKRRPGMKTWKVMDKSGRVWNNWEEVEGQLEVKDGKSLTGKLSKTMFPSGTDLPLERCMRIYPHLQDTGGFFIVVLQKKAEFKAKPETDLAGTTPANGETTASTPNVTEGKRPREDEDIEGQAASKKPKTEASEQPAASEDVNMIDQPKEESTAPAETNVAETVQQEEPEAKETATSSESQVSKPVPNQNTPVNQGKKKKEGPYEEPFKYLPADHSVIKSVKDFYKFSDRFPLDRFMVRNAMGEPAKAIYYTSELVRDILVANEGRGVRFVHGGVKMFMKQDAPSAEVCGWRIQSEGMRILHGYVGPERIIYLNKKETLRKLLIEMFPKLADGGWKSLGEVGEAALKIGLGCCVLRIEPGPEDQDMERMALPLWKSFHSVNLMLPKEDRSAMLLRIFNETAVLLNLGLSKDKAEAGKEEEGDAATNDENSEVKEESVVADVEEESKEEAQDTEEGGAKLETAEEPIKAESSNA
ncbi:tRNA (cytosine-5-)-methyltransferase NCL1 [Pyricularia oryzae]|nr:tRNA (cytosine-5-)-methyltransferase NCL1 [Pyricularia oryzae]KAI7928473.1 tRNA (cytosine-5-)-methyltransferase NCL1 [Pyricularia oryzae]